MITNIIFSAVVFLVGALILQSLRKIPASPPHVAIVVRFGKRIAEMKEEGWRFFPVYPYWHDYIKIPVSKVDQDIPSEVVKTPDLADVAIPISLTWTPDYKKDDFKGEVTVPERLINYLNNGGEKGVKNILEDIVRERLREWAISNIEGPQDWKEAQAAQEEAVAVILKSVVGEAIEHVPSSIPTTILLKYFNKPIKPLTKSEAKKWGRKMKEGETEEQLEKDIDPFNYEKVEEILGREGQKEKVEEVIKKRRDEVAAARQGNGRFHLEKLGIVINRLNIGEIKPQGEIVKATEKYNQEEQERRAEIYEVETDLKKAQKLVEEFRKSGQEISLNDAYRIILEWKVTREGKGFTIPGLAPALAGIAKKFL